MDAQQAGYETKAALLTDLDKRDGDLYRITLAYAGEDPRIALREASELSDDEFDAITQRLRRMDAASRQGEWTHTVLRLIKRHPQRAAAELAEQSGYEKQWLKTNVRKLKNLGLTISEPVGYTLSPRGGEVLKRLDSP